MPGIGRGMPRKSPGKQARANGGDCARLRAGVRIEAGCDLLGRRVARARHLTVWKWPSWSRLTSDIDRVIVTAGAESGLGEF